MTLLNSAFLSGGSIIDLDGTFFIQFGIFAIAFLVLRSLIFKPMVALFEAREEAIDGAKAEAKRLQAGADEAGQTFDEKMRQVRLGAGQERERLRAEGLKLEQDLFDKVRVETDKQLADADAKMKIEGARIRQEVGADVPTLARQIASKLLQREVN